MDGLYLRVQRLETERATTMHGAMEKMTQGMPEACLLIESHRSARPASNAGETGPKVPLHRAVWPSRHSLGHTLIKVTRASMHKELLA